MKRRKKSPARKLREGLKAIDDLLQHCDNGDVDLLVELAGAPEDFPARLHLSLRKVRADIEARLQPREVNKKPASRAG